MNARRAAIIGQLVTLAASLTYTLYVGPVVFFWDSHTFADRAKHVAYFGTLDLNNHPTSVAPPLYSICIAPAYLFEDPGITQRAILILNALLHSLSFLPLLGLFRRYSHLSAAHAASWATLVALAPHALTYAPFVLSEAAFFPLTYLVFFLFARFDARPNFRRALLIGATLGMAILCRDAGQGMLLAAAAVAIIHIAAAFWRRQALARALQYGIVGGAAAALSRSWNWYQQNHVHLNTGSGDLWAPLHAMMNSPSELLLHARWLWNCSVYLMLAPLSVVALLVIAILLTRPRILWRDRVVAWLLLSMFISAAVAIMVMNSSWGGPTLTWNRYVVPLVGLWFPIALRYRRLIGRVEYALALGMLTGLGLLGSPANLACHFPDALTPFLAYLHPDSAAWKLNAAFVGLLAVGGLPFLFMKRRAGALLAIICIGLPMTYFNREAARGWRKNVHNLAQYHGVAGEIVAQLRRAPDTTVSFDLDAAGAPENLFPLARILYLTPRSAAPHERLAMYRAAAVAEAPTIYITSAPLCDARVLGVDNGLIYANLLEWSAEDRLHERPLMREPDDRLREYLAARPAPARFVIPGAPPIGDASSGLPTIRAVRPGGKVDFEPYGGGHAIWLGPHTSGALTIYIVAPTAQNAQLRVDVAIVGPSVPTPGSCPLSVRNRWRIAESSVEPADVKVSVAEINVDSAGERTFDLELSRGLNAIELEIPADAGPGRAGADPRELMLLIRSVELAAPVEHCLSRGFRAVPARTLRASNRSRLRLSIVVDASGAQIRSRRTRHAGMMPP